MDKIGTGHAGASLRQGYKEITQVLPAFPESVRPVEEPGLVGNLTPQEVVAEKGSYEQELAKYAREAPPQPENDREMER